MVVTCVFSVSPGSRCAMRPIKRNMPVCDNVKLNITPSAYKGSIAISSARKASTTIDEMIAREMIGEEEEELVKEIQDAKPTFTHGCVEFFLHNEWIPADLTWTDEEEVGMEMPISKFGESPFGKWYNIIPDTVTRHESLPFANVRFKIAFSVLMLRGIYDRVNQRFNQIRKNGRKKLEEMGRDTYTAKKKKFYIPPPPLISE